MRPLLSEFPTPSVFGLSALLWASSERRVTDRRIPLGATVHCPPCGQPMTMEEEIDRRRGRSDGGEPS